MRMLCMAVTLCVTTAAMAQDLYDASGGTRIGKIQNNYIYDASGGKILAQINGDYVTDYVSGRHINQFMSDGRVMDGSGGTCVGFIKIDGRVMDGSGGHTLGYVERGKVYDKTHSKTIGHFRDVNVRDVAYYYFFFPKRKPL